MQLSLALVIIVLAKAGGYLSPRLGQPSVLGELLIGLVLGPSVLDLLHLGEVVHQPAELGVLLLMFIAGLDQHLKDLAAGHGNQHITFSQHLTPVRDQQVPAEAQAGKTAAIPGLETPGWLFTGIRLSMV